MNNLKNNRILWIDMSKMIAVTCVVLNHAVDEIFISSLYGDETLSICMTGFMYTFFTLGRLGVPLFFFITGALLLSREYNDERIALFYKRNLGGVLSSTLIWIVIYNIFNTVFYCQNFSVKNVVLESLFLKNCNMPHMWYMPVIIGLYFTVPFVSTVLHKISKRYIVMAGCLAFFYQFVIPSLEIVINFFWGVSEQYGVLDVNFLGSCFGIYLISGYYITDEKINRKQMVFYGMLFIVCFVLTICFQAILFQQGTVSYNVWYNFMLLYIASFSLIKILSQFKMDNIFLNRIIESISRFSLAIFFVHMPVRFVLSKYISFGILPPPIALLLFFICMYTVSIIVVFILGKNKFIRKNILLVKD